MKTLLYSCLILATAASVFACGNPEESKSKITNAAQPNAEDKVAKELTQQVVSALEKEALLGKALEILELAENFVTVKNMVTGIDEKVSQADLVNYFAALKS